MATLSARIAQYAAAPPPAPAIAQTDSFTILTPQERKQLLRHLLREIRVYRDRQSGGLDVEILWHRAEE